jgi:uncharacterized protein (TIGR03085 family)
MAHNYARDERAALCDLLTDLGPDLPTLCDGWTTRQLAAHIYLRERRPLAALGIVAPPMAGYTARVQRAVAARPFSDLVDAVRRPPGWSPTALDPVDRAANTLEMFLHHEDVRRAQPDWQPRELPRELESALWARVRRYAWLRLRRFPAALVIDAQGHGEVRTGRGDSEVRLAANPGELAIYLTGRQRAARVELTGPGELTGRLGAARLGL